MKIIVGLGNPGEQYKNTRHNVGWLALDNQLGEITWLKNKKFSALVYESENILFIKPLSFMNNSGQVVQKVLNYYKLLPKNLGFINKKNVDLNNVLTVIHDDLDLNFGDIRLVTGSGSAGHRGVESIIQYLKTKKFTRIRIGIGNELLRTHVPADKFVLQPFTPEERQHLPKIFNKLMLKQ